jgi:hypothetical protein
MPASDVERNWALRYVTPSFYGAARQPERGWGAPGISLTPRPEEMP